MKFKSTFPKEKPHEGCSHIVLGFKAADGVRLEFTGQIPAEEVQRLMGNVIELSKLAKENK